MNFFKTNLETATDSLHELLSKVIDTKTGDLLDKDAAALSRKECGRYVVFSKSMMRRMTKPQIVRMGESVFGVDASMPHARATKDAWCESISAHFARIARLMHLLVLAFDTANSGANSIGGIAMCNIGMADGVLDVRYCMSCQRAAPLSKPAPAPATPSTDKPVQNAPAPAPAVKNATSGGGESCGTEDKLDFGKLMGMRELVEKCMSAEEAGDFVMELDHVLHHKVKNGREQLHGLFHLLRGKPRAAGSGRRPDMMMLHVPSDLNPVFSKDSCEPDLTASFSAPFSVLRDDYLALRTHYLQSVEAAAKVVREFFVNARSGPPFLKEDITCKLLDKAEAEIKAIVRTFFLRTIFDYNKMLVRAHDHVVYGAV